MQIAFSDRARQIMAFGAVLCGLAGLIAIGVVGVGRSGTEPFLDVRFWFVSGHLWSHGGNPYDLAEFIAHSRALGAGDIAQFAYPPTSFWLGAPLQWFSPRGAQVAWLVVNFVALAATIAACASMLSTFEKRSLMALKLRIAGIAAILLGSPYVANVFWAGQTTLVVTALLMWSWILVHRHREVTGGILLGMASAKPQLALLVGVWYLLDRRWLSLAVAALASLVLVAIPVRNTGIRVIPDWLASTSRYLSEPSQALMLSHNMDLASAARGLGLDGAGVRLAILALGFLLFVAIWRAERQQLVRTPTAIAFLIPLSILMFFGRDYDLAACAGLITLGVSFYSGSIVRRLTLISIPVALYLPHRFVESLGVPVLNYWRPFTLFAVILLFLWWSFDESPRQDSSMPTSQDGRSVSREVAAPIRAGSR